MQLDDRKLIFIHIARTGGTSIEVALAGDDWWNISPETKHLRASQTRQLVGEAAWASSYKFTVVRNPWDRLVSMLATSWWSRPGQLNMLEFLRDLAPHPHEIYGSLHYCEIIDEPLDAIFRFESLKEDFSAIGSRTGTTVALPHSEKSLRRRHYSAYYDNDAMRLAGDMFVDDIDMFGYSFERLEAFDAQSFNALAETPS